MRGQVAAASLFGRRSTARQLVIVMARLHNGNVRRTFGADLVRFRASLRVLFCTSLPNGVFSRL
jgi:hypothetical protein